MPDVTRTDSQRSDTSLRPRVSFNRDVHVKRIVPREGPRPVAALSGDGEGHLVRPPVRRERLTSDRRQLAAEAARVLSQVDRIDCQTTENGSRPEKFHTLPARRKLSAAPERTSSLDRRAARRGSVDQVVAPRKPPRTFAAAARAPHTLQPARPKKSSLRRAVSDAAGDNELRHRRQRTAGGGEDASALLRHQHHKKQLSPIIEVAQREDYFAPTWRASASFKENDKNVDNDARAPARRKKQQQQQQQQTHSVVIERPAAGAALHTSATHAQPDARIKNQVVVIDVDQATRIDGARRSRLSAAAIGRKLLKSLALRTAVGKHRGAKEKLNKADPTPVIPRGPPVEAAALSKYVPPPPPLPADRARSRRSLVLDAIESIQSRTHQRAGEMIHSSQQPVERLPLTRGRTVDTLVKKLSYESASPPPKASVTLAPGVAMQHNGNQPFSYTRGLSPERSPTSPTTPVIYAQVVCGTNGAGGKQTVHTAYAGKKHLPHSDSDEGLGYEETSGGFRSSEKSVTHFGDDGKYMHKADYYNGTSESPRFEEEYPITPKFQNNGYNGYHYDGKFAKLDQGLFIDSSSRGRGDGMDSKRRESLTETFEHATSGKFTATTNTLVGGGRKDLSARRDLLESRITRRFGEKRGSPEYSPKATYITESTRYYRSGSASPGAGRDKHISESKIETNKYQAEKYRCGFDSEPKSFDSQVSDYRSSPRSRHFETSQRSAHHNKYAAKSEKQPLSKERNFYKSNPEIHMRSYNYDEHRRFHDSYHDSLKRGEIERKDKFGDSGIENDFRRDSGERRKRGEFSNESEDEGFASSLLIASERQHTEDNFARRNRRGYDSDRGYAKDDDYRHLETMEYKNAREYAPRERSIDDGSHFDPRIDKNVIGERRVLKKIDKKPPKPEKKSSLEKVKQLFTSSKKKKEKQAGMVREESLRARYTEYKGTPEPTFRNGRQSPPSNTGYECRRRVSPSPSPTRVHQRKSAPLHGSWFKSLDRLSRKKTKKIEKDGNQTSTEDEITAKPTKSLRFFGDTDQESTDSVPHKSALKAAPRAAALLTHRHRSQSTRDLHNISEETHRHGHHGHHGHHHKSLLNIHAETDREAKGLRALLKPPVSPAHRIREPSRPRDDRSRRRKNEVSSVESSTEGDSSQQSQRSVVYLHAATVGDIPGPGCLRNGRRAASREELASNGSSRIQPHVKTLSRSLSVLAPWRPRHYHEAMDIDYTQYPKPVKSGKYEPYRNGASRRESSTLKKKAAESRRANQNVSTLGNKKSRSKENVSSTLKRGEAKSSSASLYKKKERQPKENNRYNRDEKRIASKSMSVESLGSNRSGGRKGDVSRSASMPRDPEKSAGWFNVTKKGKRQFN